MIQALATLLARLCVWVVGLPAVSLETRRSEAAKAARDNVALCVGYREDFDDEAGAVATQGGETVDARGMGFGEYLGPACDCDDADDDGQGRVRA